MPGPLTVNVTATPPDLAELYAAIPGANPHTLNAHLCLHGAVWTTTSTHQFVEGPTWSALTGLLVDATRTHRPARIHIHLPEPTHGARGHITVNDTRHTLIALPRAADLTSPYQVACRYPYLDPATLIALPDHTRALLNTLAQHLPTTPHRWPTPNPPAVAPRHRDGIAYPSIRRQPNAGPNSGLNAGRPAPATPQTPHPGACDHAQLLEHYGPFLNAPPPTAHTLTAAMQNVRPAGQRPDLDTLTNLLHAFN